jgi:hypothetical protein
MSVEDIPTHIPRIMLLIKGCQSFGLEKRESAGLKSGVRSSKNAILRMYRRGRIINIA